MTRSDTIYRDAPALAPTVLVARTDHLETLPPRPPVERSNTDTGRDQRGTPAIAAAAS